MRCNFQVGQKVVCISAAHNAEAHEAWSRSRGFDVRYPVVGTTYTIREVFLHESGVIALRFRELVNPALPYANKVSELAMDARHFRPVAERGTDAGMSILRELLNKTDQPVREDA
ncbi:hypothetical protein B5M44_21910 [Shinella sumterensis]|uniref:hypothetical protein n=1 Tax=Shinella sumterensis TaxID=1967501 RepID=UPI00106E4476|nr:hypothetical protein [Shinella sumterensis]MCD1266924.1 hypothetical protein [Shinella sumterensis]TFE95194.1 hypothetical protein B5M44_21910 [Shinella sumterensis]